MTKKTKLVMLLGLLSLFAPSVTYAQRQVAQGLETASKISEIVSALQRAAVEREMAGGVGRIKGIHVAPVVHTGWSWAMQLERQALVNPAHGAAIRAGMFNMPSLVDALVEDGVNPSFAFLGALVEGNLDFSGKIVRKYNIDVNAPVLDDKTALELLPNVQKGDARVKWLFDNGFNPALHNGYVPKGPVTTTGKAPVEDMKNPYPTIPWADELGAKGIISAKERDAMVAAIPELWADLDWVKRAVAAGAAPKLAFFGAVARGYLNLAGEIVREYNIDVNAPVLRDMTVLDLLPPVRKDDPRVKWLFDNGFNPAYHTEYATSLQKQALLMQIIHQEGVDPNWVMMSGGYRNIDDLTTFKALVEKGLHPMASDENDFTALHWYAQKFAYMEEDETFLRQWMEKFPGSDPNVQDINGNTPLHFLDNTHYNGYKTFRQFERLPGINPSIKNNAGQVPFMKPEFQRLGGHG